HAPAQWSNFQFASGRGVRRTAEPRGNFTLHDGGHVRFRGVIPTFPPPATVTVRSSGGGGGAAGSAAPAPRIADAEAVATSNGRRRKLTRATLSHCFAALEPLLTCRHEHDAAERER